MAAGGNSESSGATGTMPGVAEAIELGVIPALPGEVMALTR